MSRRMRRGFWRGAFSVPMAVFMAVCFHGYALGQSAVPALEGDWHGTLKAGGAELRLVLHVSKGENGDWKATLDSVDQGANGIPVTSMSFKESKLVFTLDSIHGSYEGKIQGDGTAIAGTWTQGQSLPL